MMLKVVITITEGKKTLTLQLIKFNRLASISMNMRFYQSMSPEDQSDFKGKFSETASP